MSDTIEARAKTQEWYGRECPCGTNFQCKTHTSQCCEGCDKFPEFLSEQRTSESEPTLDRAFYELTVAQRDAAWREIERLTSEAAQVAAAKAVLDWIDPPLPGNMPAFLFRDHGDLAFEFVASRRAASEVEDRS